MSCCADTACYDDEYSLYGHQFCIWVRNRPLWMLPLTELRGSDHILELAVSLHNSKAESQDLSCSSILLLRKAGRRVWNAKCVRRGHSFLFCHSNSSKQPDQLLCLQVPPGISWPTATALLLEHGDCLSTPVSFPSLLGTKQHVWERQSLLTD